MYEGVICQINSGFAHPEELKGNQPPFGRLVTAGGWQRLDGGVTVF